LRKTAPFGKKRLPYEKSSTRSRMKLLSLVLLLLLGVFCHGQTWLSLPAATGYVDIGDLDIPGNQLTVEALYTSTNNASVDLVSKHSGTGDVNYLLRRTHCELSTTSGFITTPQACPPDLNTCRHAAMVYDGANLNFYLNGQLNGQIGFSGNMIQNNFQTLIGNYGCCFGGEQFFGFIDEVRIWNVARTQAQIQTFMFSSLPTPTLQIGLQAYYSFSTPLNLQGNSAWDGIVAGTASIGATNPFCAGLSPLCVVLGGNFGRFTAAAHDGGLQLDWIWNGEAPQYFELESGSDPQSLAPSAQLPAGDAAAWLANVPARQTWLRLSAVTQNGEVVLSNIVQFEPSAASNGLRLQPDQDFIKVLIPRSMQVEWRIVDAMGRLHSSGQLAANRNFEIPLPTQYHGILMVQAKGDGQTQVLKCIRP
jgi:Concanavalin A-like lectin/glucanases superfamily